MLLNLYLFRCPEPTGYFMTNVGVLHNYLLDGSFLENVVATFCISLCEIEIDKVSQSYRS